MGKKKDWLNCSPEQGIQELTNMYTSLTRIQMFPRCRMTITHDDKIHSFVYPVFRFSIPGLCQGTELRDPWRLKKG